MSEMIVVFHSLITCIFLYNYFTIRNAVNGLENNVRSKRRKDEMQNSISVLLMTTLGILINTILVVSGFIIPNDLVMLILSGVSSVSIIHTYLFISNSIKTNSPKQSIKAAKVSSLINTIGLVPYLILLILQL